MVAPFEKFDLTGRNALVTGGATGLGFHMARALARAGATVMIAARREELLKTAVATLNDDPFIKGACYHPVDLVNRDSVDALARHAIETLGGIDILVGNAGATYAEQLGEIKLDSVDAIFQLNLTSNIQLTQAFLPRMKQNKWGRFIFSSSIGSIQSLAHQGTGIYNTTKAAVNAFARSIAGDVGHYNITANALVLGFYKTDILADAEQQVAAAYGAEAAKRFLQDFEEMSAVGRIGHPSEVEGLVQLLASDAGSYITGASIPIDGGMSIMMRPLKVD